MTTALKNSFGIVFTDNENRADDVSIVVEDGEAFDSLGIGTRGVWPIPDESPYGDMWNFHTVLVVGDLEASKDEIRTLIDDHISTFSQCLTACAAEVRDLELRRWVEAGCSTDGVAADDPVDPDDDDADDDDAGDDDSAGGVDGENTEGEGASGGTDEDAGDELPGEGEGDSTEEDADEQGAGEDVTDVDDDAAGDAGDSSDAEGAGDAE